MFVSVCYNKTNFKDTIGRLLLNGCTIDRVFNYSGTFSNKYSRRKLRVRDGPRPISPSVTYQR